MRTRRWRLWLGVLKLAHREQLDFDERRGFWPSLRIGNHYLIWKSNAAVAAAAENSRNRSQQRPPRQERAGTETL